MTLGLGFVFLAGLLLWAIAASRGHWLPKAGATVLVALFSLTVWHALGTYAGWPAHPPLPSKAVLDWALVHEPDPSRGDRGQIYLWLTPIALPGDAWPLAHHTQTGAPRAYILPYSRHLHQQVERGLAQIMHGQIVVVDRQGRGSGTRLGQNGQRIRRQDFRIYALPPSKPPVKEHQ